MNALSLSQVSLKLVMCLAFLLLVTPARAQNRDEDSYDRSSNHQIVSRSYSMEDRVKYQLWNYYWRPDPSQPITRVVVHIKEQRVYVYQGNNIIASSPITTGKPGYETPTGHFTVMIKDIDHKSNLYGSYIDGTTGQIVNSNAEAKTAPPAGCVYDAANMPYYLRLCDNGVGFHAGFLPGYAASHGCIRLPHAFAELMYWNVALSTPVDIVE